MSHQQWYLMQGSEQPTGPYPTETILEAIQGGRMQLGAKVCPFGGTSWVPVGNVPQFADAARKVAPPPPASPDRPAAPAAKPAERREPGDSFGVGEFLFCVLLALPALFVGIYRVAKGWHSGSPMIMTSILTMLVAPVAFSLLVPALVKTAEVAKPSGPSAAYVRCLPAGGDLGDGFTCSVEHKSGPGALVCWSLEISCRNGQRYSPSACETVKVGATASKEVLVPGWEKCDRVTASKLDHVDVTGM